MTYNASTPFEGELSKNNSRKNEIATQSVAKFHENSMINEVIENYNKISDNKISTNDLNNDYPYQVFFSHNDLWIRISHNDSLKKIFIDFDYESSDISMLKTTSSLFLKSLDNLLTEKEINTIFINIQTYKYSGYEYYKFKNFELQLTKSELNNGSEMRFKLKTSYAY